jgi:hypothetical protein
MASYDPKAELKPQEFQNYRAFGFWTTLGTFFCRVVLRSEVLAMGRPLL